MSKQQEYAELIASSIIKQLEEGTAPWVKPWKAGERYLPYNATSGKNYKGMNTVWLMSVAEKNGYDDSRWMTYKQALAFDAQVNQGEKGTQIQMWKFQDEIAKRDEQGQPVLDAEGKPVKVTVLLERPQVRSAIVFNASQITGLSPVIRPAMSEWDRHQEAEAMLKDSGATLQHIPGNRAFYRPSSDSITLPLREQFPTADNYYATALHELGHWTGHSSRLNRDLGHPFGSVDYAKEELRAEIASLMLGEQLSIGHDPGQHAAYVGSWIQVLQEDPREIFRAAADAEKIVKYLRGREMQQTQEPVSQIMVPITAHIPALTLAGNAERVYLSVPYVEKEEAKALGAKWDRKEKSWYASPGNNLEPLARWLSSTAAVQLSLSTTPHDEFAQALTAAGLIVPGLPVMNGELIRVAVEGDRYGEKSGAYAGYLDGHPAGYIKNYKTGYEVNWKSAQPVPGLSALDKARLEMEAADKRVIRTQEREALASQTARSVEVYWQASSPAVDHPYLRHKNVPSYGLRINTLGVLPLTGGKGNETPQYWSSPGDLLVPVQDIDGNFWAAQSIDGSGRKSFPRGSKLQGGHFIIGEIGQSTPLLIAEGYATGATLHELTGLPVAVAFHSGNLPTVAAAYREKYPELVLIIAGDNDHHKPQDKNIGDQKAQEAAQRVGGYTLLPDFDLGEAGTDWNDLVKLKGKEPVRYRLDLAIGVAKTLHFKKQQANPLSLVVNQQRDTKKQAPSQEISMPEGRSISL